MAKKLLIVESPAKASTINKYLGGNFEVLATYGHIRDLPSKDGAVDTENNFAMHYELSEGSKKYVDAIVRVAKKAEAIYLATDLDREGEAISWHVCEVLREKGLAGKIPWYRVEFSEITPKAIRDAVDNPRELSMNLVNAQQARRALDHLVGFNLSPLLWKKIKPRLSAGRVQSPALRMIVEREREIEAFKPQEYWSIEADLLREGKEFTARLVKLKGERLKQFDLNNEKQVTAIRDQLLRDTGGKLQTDRVKRKQRKRRPVAPFITSTLQVDASRKLRFSAQKTMRTAQRLYEGVSIEGESRGLITYMRTDSLSLSNDALADLRAQIAKRFGEDFLPEEPVKYKTKSKNAQEAHEAIRPTSADLTPERVKPFLADEQFRLYELIWRRTMACQMSPALLDTVQVEFDCSDGATFRANGSVITFPGFLAVYEESTAQGAEEKEARLPKIDQGDPVELAEIRNNQHFTEPPPRFSEASLVKTLEEYGIGRPSTYASIISTLQRREYVEMEKRRFQPTDTGRVVSRFLGTHFDHYVDYEFTARLEDELDGVSRGEIDWIPLLESFWKPFIERVREKEETVSRQEAKQTRVLGTDPKTGRQVSVRLGRYGPHAQIGAVDDEIDEKPKFASLLKGQSLETITLEQVFELFKLPRDLGLTPEGEAVSAAIGRFGPYIRYANKFVSLKEDDPYTVELPKALELIAEKKEFDANRVIRTFTGTDIEVLRGRYGPYITNGQKNARIPKDREPESLTLEECQALIEAAPDRRRGKKKVSKKKATRKKSSKKTSKKKTTRKKTARKKASRKKTPGKKTAKKRVSKAAAQD
jgi:DNA topoisomerase-1